MIAKFAPGDIVEVVDATNRAPSLEFIRIGLRGTVIKFIGPAPVVRHDNLSNFYDCEFAGVGVFAAECRLRKVPPDPGRELIEWDWQELITKQPECV